MSPLDFHDPLCAAKAPSTAPESPEGWGLPIPSPWVRLTNLCMGLFLKVSKRSSPSLPLGDWACAFLRSLTVPCSGGHADPAYPPQVFPRL